MATRSVELRVTGNITGAAAALDKLDEKLDKLLEKIDKLSHSKAMASVELHGGDKVQEQVDKINLELDKLGRKDVTAKVKLKYDKDHLKGILGDLGGGGGGGSSEIGKLGGEAGGGGGDLLATLGGANNAYFGAAIGLALTLATSLLPAVVPLLLGGGVGGGALFGALQTKRGKKAGKGILSNLGNTIKGSLFENQLTDSGKRIPGTSVLDGILKMLHQVNGFINQIGPQLGDMFRASLPFISAFVKIFEQFAKAAMPAITQSMKAFAPYLPQITQAFKSLSEGIADFIVDLGPGIKNGVTIFNAVMVTVKGLLIGLAYVADGLAYSFVQIGHKLGNMAHDFHNWWNLMFKWAHQVDGRILHDTEATWNWIYAHTIAKLENMANGIRTRFESIRTVISAVMNTVRSQIASAWNTIWANTIGRVENGISRVQGYFHGLPGRIRSALGNLGTLLYDAGRNVISGLINGIESMIGSLGSAMGGIASKIRGFLPFSPAKEGPLSGSGSPDVAGRKIGQMLATGITQSGTQVANAASGLANHVIRSYGASTHGHSAGGAGAVSITLEYAGTGGNFEREMFKMMANGIRTRGGDPRILTQKVKLA